MTRSSVCAGGFGVVGVGTVVSRRVVGWDEVISSRVFIEG